MAQFVTQIEGDHIILMEAETSGAFAKSDLEIKPNPMAALGNSMEAVGRIGSLCSERLRAVLAGTGTESAEVSFGIKCDQIGSIMIAQEHEKAQFSVRLNIRVA
jgi:hypothetical protein